MLSQFTLHCSQIRVRSPKSLSAGRGWVENNGAAQEGAFELLVVGR